MRFDNVTFFQVVYVIISGASSDKVGNCSDKVEKLSHKVKNFSNKVDPQTPGKKPRGTPWSAL
jgi:hypothetical protein